jgi:hypothetical protein
VTGGTLLAAGIGMTRGMARNGSRFLVRSSRPVYSWPTMRCSGSMRALLSFVLSGLFSSHRVGPVIPNYRSTNR